MQVENLRPSILVFAGLDPSGGAGLQADIEAISHCGGHAVSIASCLTVQNTHGAKAIHPVDKQVILDQAEALLTDMPISACKIGVLPDKSTVTAIAGIISQLSNIPIILDPVLGASQGITFADAMTIQTIQEQLFANITVMTPNTQELNQLIHKGNNLNSKAQMLCALGPEYVLVTGADEKTPDVEHLLFNKDGLIDKFKCQRLANNYHGSGCTLSSALATFLAMNLSIKEAIEKAQQYTWLTLKNAEPLGAGQWIPNRNSKHI